MERNWLFRHVVGGRWHRPLAVGVLGVLAWGVVVLSSLQTPPPSLLLLDRDGRFLAQFASGGEEQGYGYWPIDALPARVVAATLALEDRRFYSHPGVDPLAVARAVLQNLAGGRRVSGASTIAMQVARMGDPGPRHWGRKVLEAVSALLITLRHGREEVLRHYLRLVPYGNQSHGIAHAARLYLDKPVEDLSWAEIALLAAIPQAPSHMNPFTPAGRQRAVGRGLRILQSLHEQGVIATTDYQIAHRQIQQLEFAAPQRRPVAAIHAALHIRQWLASRHFAPPPTLVRTTLHLPLQRAVHEMVGSRLELLREAGAEQAAVVVVRLADASVVAWLGSRDYFSSRAGAMDYGDMPRSSGSTLKPFLYGLALERGVIGPDSILADIPAVSHGVSNADGRYLGPLLPRQALANSRNVPAVDLLDRVGEDTFLQLLRQLELDGAMLSAKYYGLGLAIGALPVTLENLVTAYTVLAGEGGFRPLRWLADEPISAGHELLSPVNTRLITHFLADPHARLPTFARLNALEYPFPVAVKTGTSQGYRDAWTVAYSLRYLVAAWVGRPDASPMKHIGGADSAALLVHDVMKHLHYKPEEGFFELDFPPPKDYQRVVLCAHSGLRDWQRCGHTVNEWLPTNHHSPLDDTQEEVAVDQRNGLLATQWTPFQQRVRRTFIRLPGIFSQWARQHGFPTPPTSFSSLDIPSELGRDAMLQDALSAAGQPAHITLHTPRHRHRIYRNPQDPPELNLLVLRASIDPPMPQAVWYVDERPWRLVEPPYTTTWPLQEGKHIFQLKLPFRPERSSRVSVEIF